jgi:hypothetical protein
MIRELRNASIRRRVHRRSVQIRRMAPKLSRVPYQGRYIFDAPGFHDFSSSKWNVSMIMFSTVFL